ncbi:MAG: ankyrin repeat domain-containing protein [Fuerstiella sp.]
MGQRIFDKAAFYVRKGRRDKLLHLITKHSYLHQSHEACLIFTAIWDRPDMLPWLLSNGIHPDSRLGPNGNTPLMQAASSDEQAVMHLLIAAGADVNARNEQNEAPLGFACAWTQWPAAKLLIEHGANVNAVEDGHSTYLDWAITGSHNEGVELLLAHGAKQFCDLIPNTGT